MRDGWRAVTVGEILERQDSRLGAAPEPRILTCTEKDGLVDQFEHWGRRVATDDVSKYKLVHPDDVVYNVYLLWLGAIGQNVTGEVGITSPVYEVFSPRAHVEPRFIGLLLKTPEMLRAYGEISIGTVPRRRRAPWQDFLRISVTIPPLVEQRRIMDLIGTIDDAIEAEDVAASRSAYLLGQMLNHAVSQSTAGEVATLGSVLSVTRGGSPRPIDDYYTSSPDGLNWVRIGDVSPDGKYIEKTEKRIEARGLNKTRTVEPGDFVLSNSMSFGRPYIMRIHGCIHDGWLKLSGFQEHFTEDYLYYLLRSGTIQSQFNSLAAGSSVRNLNKDKVAGIEVVIPSLAEQARVSSDLDQIGELAEHHLRVARTLRVLRDEVLAALLSGDHEIPESYDELIEEVA